MKLRALFICAMFRLFCQITWRYLVEDTRLHIHRPEPLESHIYTSTLLLHAQEQCSAEQY